MSMDVDITPLYSDGERRRLQELRAKFSETHDHFTDREKRRLCFLRWYLRQRQAPPD